MTKVEIIRLSVAIRFAISQTDEVTCMQLAEQPFVSRRNAG